MCSYNQERVPEEKKPTIRFSHYYEKMPPRWILLTKTAKTIITSLNVVEKKDLPQKFIDEDTAYRNEGTMSYYPLPEGKLLIISLQTAGLDYEHKWQTVRRYAPQKATYYEKLIGKEVRIEVNE